MRDPDRQVTTQSRSDHVNEPMSRRAWTVLLLGSMCAFITSLNQSIMSVAYADLRRSFPDVSASNLSWILNVYTIVAGATLILSAVASNRYGRKRMLLLGLSTFAVSGLACAAATGPATLIVARAVQALGWALITPSAVAMILADVPLSRRASAIALWGGVGGISTALGPSLGALLIDVGTWRAAFLVSVPFAVAVIVIGAKVFSEAPAHELVREGWPDVASAIALFVGVTLFILGLVESPTWGWADSRTLGCIAAGAVLIAWLLWRSTTVAIPIIDPRLLRYRNLRLTVMMSIGFGTGFFATSLGLVIFLTDVWGYRVVGAGALITPIAGMVTVLAPVAGRIGDRFGHRVLAVPAGLAWMTGSLWLFFGAGSEPDLFGVWFPATFLIGIGSGFAWPVIHGIPVLGIEQRDLGPVVATNQTVLRVVGAFGVAIAVTLTSAESGAAALGPFRRLFVLMAASGLLMAAIGAFVTTSPRRR